MPDGRYPPKAVADVIRVLSRLSLKQGARTDSAISSAIGDYFTDTGEIAPDVLAGSLSDATPAEETFGAAGDSGDGTLGSRDDHIHPMPAEPSRLVVSLTNKTGGTVTVG